MWNGWYYLLMIIIVKNEVCNVNKVSTMFFITIHYLQSILQTVFSIFETISCNIENMQEVISVWCKLSGLKEHCVGAIII